MKQSCQQCISSCVRPYVLAMACSRRSVFRTKEHRPGFARLIHELYKKRRRATWLARYTTIARELKIETIQCYFGEEANSGYNVLFCGDKEIMPIVMVLPMRNEEL